LPALPERTAKKEFEEIGRFDQVPLGPAAEGSAPKPYSSAPEHDTFMSFYATATIPTIVVFATHGSVQFRCRSFDWDDFPHQSG